MAVGIAMLTFPSAARIILFILHHPDILSRHYPFHPVKNINLYNLTMLFYCAILKL